MKISSIPSKRLCSIQHNLTGTKTVLPIFETHLFAHSINLYSANRKEFTRLIMLVVIYFLLLFSAQTIKAQCTFTTQYPAGTTNAGTGALVTIANNSFEGEYSQITGIVSGADYEFTISRANDYITVRVGSSNGTLLGFGQTPLTVTATSGSDLYVHWSRNAACQTGSTNRTTTVQQTAPPPPVISSLGATNGCAGSSITINGTNLSGATSVTIGGTPVSAITTNTATQIVATIGSGSTGTVSVTTSGGTGTSASSFTVNGLPTITTSASAASKCYSASAQNSTLSYSGTTNTPNSYTITWDATALSAGLVNVGSTALPASPITVPIAAGVAAGTYTGTLKVSNANGCSSTGNTFTLTISSYPVMTSASSAGICSGSTVSIPLTSSVSSTYTWVATSNGNVTGESTTTQTTSTLSNTLTISTGSVQTVAYTVTPTSVAGGCVGSSQAVSVIVSTRPTITSSATAATRCFSSNAQTSTLSYSATTNSPSTYNITWNAAALSAGLVNVSSTSLPTSPITFPIAAGVAAGTYTGTLTVTNTSGCSSTGNSFTVTVNGLPTITTSASAASKCYSASAQNSTLSYSGTTNTPNSYTITWDATALSAGLVNVGSTALPASPITVPIAAGVAAGIYTGTLTVSNANGCSSTGNSFTVTINSTPSVTITADYCIGGGAVRLTASAQTSYLWSTGATTQYIDISTPGNYSVTGTNASGCTASANITVSQELVTNGNFSSGNTGFTTLYTYVGTPSSTALWTEGTYSVGTNANNYHSGFYCSQDHTSGAGNFMIVNGSPATQEIWEQTVAVTPNTTYYFSAWATSLNNGTPFAQLQFAVNNVQVGTTITLPAGATSTAGPFTWYRFYGSWNSGSSTSATINIIDLQTALGGNDFGLDDISFSTFSPVSISVAPTTNSPVCAGSALNLTANLTGGNSPFTYNWTGPSSYTSSSQNPSISSAAAGNAGAYSLTVTDAYGCTATGSTASVMVNGLPTIALSSAAGTTAQTVCNSTAITNITYSVGGTGTGAGVSGLPTGVSGSYSGGLFTISGTPTANGTFSYTVTTSGGSCTAATATGTITVNGLATITRTSAAATTAQTVCNGTAITNITYSVGGTGTGAGVSGLPTGVSGSYSGGVFTISGTPTANGTFSYIVTTTGGSCPVTSSGTITVNGLPTISLSSAAATTSQTVCNSTAITNITYSVGGTATGAGASGLPTGVTGNYSGGVFTISGTPTANGTFSYTVTTTGGSCTAATASGTITVNGLATITRTSAAATTAQTVCNGTAITNITYSVGGTGTGAGVSGLPTGVTGSYSGGVFTISGIPTANGTFNYTVTTTGGSCPATATGTLTVNGLATITRTSAAATTNQTVCNSTAITNITYSVGGTGTGAGVAGLPAGVTGSYSAGVFTISGTPTANGTFNYTVTTTGGSCPVTATGTITVNGLATISRTSAAATTNQTVCNNTAITSITYSVGGTGTGAGVTGLPTGITGSYSAGVFTISGTPTANGTFNYTVTTTGGSCPVTATGTITVNGLATISRTSAAATTNQTVCSGTAITNITYSVGGTGTGASVAGLPTGVTGSYSAGVFTISGIPTANGIFNYTVATTGGSCTTATATGTITVNALPTDKSITAVSTTICSSTTATIQVAASQVGANYQLRDNSTNANIGSGVAGSGGTISLPSGALTATTTFNVLATNGTTSCSVQMSTTVTVTANPSGQWVGGTSGDWNASGNWCGGIPSASTNVIIPANTTVTIQSGNAVANSVTIAANGNLVMNGNNNLTISSGGSFTNNGNFNASGSTGSVIFAGSGTIGGTTTFNNVDTYGSLDFGTASTIGGTFTIQTGGSVIGNSPSYTCPSATLLYKTGGTYLRGLEWTTTSAGSGCPSNVIIDNNTVINFPVAGQGYVCNDLDIETGSSLRQDYSGGSASLKVGRNVTINGTLSLGGTSGGDLYVGGNWTRNSSGVFNANDRMVIFEGTGNFSGNGTSMSTISAPASSAKDNEGGFGGEKFAHIWINKTNASDSVVLLSNITVTREIGFTKGTFSLRNSDVTIVSNDTRTADIAPVTNTANASIRYGGTGRFSIQRFIHNPTQVRSWRLLAAPLETSSAPSINDAYQEGVVNPDRNNPNGSGGIYNPWPGYGTHITGPGGTYSAANGFDQGTNSASILYGTPGLSGWLAPLSTKAIKVTDQEGWMLFVRGDRSFLIGNQYVSSQSTILEPKGKINIGDVVKPVVAGKQVIGNPYASAISLMDVDIAGTAGKNSTYYMWDPKMYTSYTQPGKWVTFTGVGTGFVQTTSESPYTSDGKIESGQAFVLEAASGGNITFHESDKLPLNSSLVGITSGMSARPLSTPNMGIFRSDMYVKSGTKYTLTDAVVNVFNGTFENKVDEADAKKIITFNTKESFSIYRDSVKLAIEKRYDLTDNDTVFFVMSKMNELSYQLRFTAENFNPAVTGYLEDKYLNLKSPISMSGATAYDFTITADPLSKAEDRFKVVFKPNYGGVLPVTFTGIKAAIKNTDIAVQWNVANELNIKNYEVQKSVNGLKFETVNTTPSAGNYAGSRNYDWLDENATAGLYYYRIRSIDNNNKEQYSRVVKVNMGKLAGSVTVYPNPITNGVIKLRFSDMVSGKYSARLMNGSAQLILSKQLSHAGGNAVYDITPVYKLAKGVYNLELTSAGNKKTIQKVIIE